MEIMNNKRTILTPYEGKFNAFSGEVIDLVEPTPGMIKPEDIVAGLSKICRFNGQISHFYSVAQHSVLVAHFAPPALKRAALLHDAAEAYIGDVISPLKELLKPDYTNIERKLEACIFEAFGEHIDNLALIKPYDAMAYALEAKAFKYGYIQDWANIWQHQLKYDVMVWNPNYAAKAYAEQLYKIFSGQRKEEMVYD